MRETTIGQLLLENALPPESYQPGTELNKKGVKKLFQHLANNHPDQYRHIAQRLNEVGSTAAYMEGTSFDIDSFKTPGIVLEARQRIRKKLARVLSNPTFTPKQRNDKIIEVVGEESNQLVKDIVDNNRSNPLTEQILSGARGNAVALKRLIGGDLLYLNHRDEPIPLVVESSYSEGLKPAEYWAATYGARKGLAEGKLGVGKGGYLSKLLNQLSHKLMVTAIDSPDEMPEGAVRGLPVDVDDTDNIGSLLAENIGGHKRNTVITPKVLADIKKAGRDTLLIRSPLVGGPPDGGLYARDVGIRELGRLADLGSLPGLTGVQALCLDGNTLVRMADWSVKAIKDIEPGEYVLGCSTAGVVKPSLVINKYTNGKKECFKTVFRLGTGRSNSVNMLEVVSTLEHKILAVLHTKIAPRPAAVITPIKRPEAGGRFYAKLSQAYDDTGCIDEPFALAIGLLIGDGCYNGGVSSGGIELSCWDNTLILDIAEYFIDLGCYLKEQSSYGHYRVSDINGGKNIGSYSGIRNPIKKKLAELGLWGAKSYEKKLPDTTKWTNKSVADLVAGLWATDGWVSLSKAGRAQLGYASSSRQLVEQLRLVLMLRFGIYGSAIITSRKKRKDGTYYRDNYKLIIGGFENIQRFAININNIPGVKGPRLQELVEYISSIKTNKVQEAGRCSFVSQTAVGVLDTYDLEIEHPDHLFLQANGLIVSNSERLAQSALSSKHSGGVLGGAQTIGGFPAIEQMINVPKHYKDGATHAQNDGRVSFVEENPLGGWHVFVGNEQHFVAPGLNPTVKKGDNLEAGDIMSEGLPNPAEFVKHKGIGEGSRQFVKHFMDVFKGAGMPANRRNVELLARGFINHVEFDEDYENWLPGDVTSYSGIERNWRVRDRSQLVKPASSINKYLETPVLHYTIGTRITPSVLSNLNKYGIKQVTVHDDPPPFSPTVIRGSASVSYDDNWLSRLLGSQQQKVLLTAARQGDTADMLSTSYVPAKAQGESFGKDWPNKLLSDYK